MHSQEVGVALNVTRWRRRNVYVVSRAFQPRRENLGSAAKKADNNQMARLLFAAAQKVVFIRVDDPFNACVGCRLPGFRDVFVKSKCIVIAQPDATIIAPVRWPLLWRSNFEEGRTVVMGTVNKHDELCQTCMLTPTRETPSSMGAVWMYCVLQYCNIQFWIMSWCTYCTISNTYRNNIIKDNSE